MFLYKFLTSILYFIFNPFLKIIFFKHNFKQRISFRNLYLENTVWIHCASLGEVNAVKPLVKKLLETNNEKNFLMTCVTKTGLNAAKEISGKLIVRQFPLDIAHIMKKAFKAFKPNLIILVETEIWPNMLNQAYKAKIPVLMINARLSHKSFKRYRLFKWFLRREFSVIKMVCAQSDKDADKFKQLKFKNVINANNLKFAMELPEYQTHVLRQAWGYKFNDFIIAIGSSRPGEELLIKKVFEKLQLIIPKLKIIIVPRHLHRLTDVTALFSSKDYSLFSESIIDKSILIVDEMGVLPQVYALSDIAIIGGSFYNFGGHNPLEAVWYEKPVIIGEYHQSCLATVEKLMTEKAIIVSNTDQLFNDILTLYQNIEHRLHIGKKAKEILLENQYALKNHWDALKPWIN